MVTYDDEFSLFGSFAFWIQFKFPAITTTLSIMANLSRMSAGSSSRRT